jgi:hypothetical protein
MKPGTRVGAILGGADGKVDFLGYGTYKGDEVPSNTGPKSMTGMLAEVGCPNPKIELDNGDVVWGCECWWGPEPEVRKRLDGLTVTLVRICDYRG